ncbi:MAG: hypothetical protein KJ011_06565 [Burkholderiaceae bacterium]|nr:hypothetical protein [Burkholderiaceae bacterium]
MDHKAIADALYADTPEPAAAAVVRDGVDSGAVFPGVPAAALARALSTELREVGITGPDAGHLVAALAAPAPADAANRVGAINKALHREFGDGAPKLAADAAAWLQRTAPSIAQSLAGSRAASDEAVTRQVIRAYQRAKARGKA